MNIAAPRGVLIDGGAMSAQPAWTAQAKNSAANGEAALREFLRQFAEPASPQTGWDLRMEEVAATMEAVVVSHRTGQPESPERFRRLRR